MSRKSRFFDLMTLTFDLCIIELVRDIVQLPYVKWFGRESVNRQRDGQDRKLYLDQFAECINEQQYPFLCVSTQWMNVDNRTDSAAFNHCQ